MNGLVHLKVLFATERLTLNQIYSAHEALHLQLHQTDTLQEAIKVLLHLVKIEGLFFNILGVVARMVLALRETALQAQKRKKKEKKSKR